MAEYRSKIQTVEQWQRCYRIVVESALGKVTRIDFLEEAVRSVDGDESSEAVPGCSLLYATGEQIPLRNVRTGDVIDGRFMTHDDLYRALYSAYRQAAEVRDAANQPPT